MEKKSLWDDDDFITKKPIVEDIKITPKQTQNTEEQPNHDYIITEDKIEDEIPAPTETYVENPVETVESQESLPNSEIPKEEIKEEGNSENTPQNEQPAENPQNNDNNDDAIKPIFKKVLFGACILVCIIAVVAKFSPKKVEPQSPENNTPIVSETEDLSNQEKEELGSESLKDVEINFDGMQVMDVSKVVEKVLPAVVSIILGFDILFTLNIIFMLISYFV